MAEKILTPRQGYWLKHIRQAAMSEVSMVAYAARHKLSVKALYQWKAKLTKLGLWDEQVSRSPGFIAVKPAPGLVAGLDCTISLPNGARIVFRGDLTAEAIRSIVSGVG